MRRNWTWVGSLGFVPRPQKNLAKGDANASPASSLVFGNFTISISLAGFTSARLKLENDRYATQNSPQRSSPCSSDLGYFGIELAESESFSRYVLTEGCAKRTH